jgi:NlpC/P60 family putative phage cell wall peptidase
MTGSGNRRARIVAAARIWLGTPYHHQASLRGVGCDCLGLVRGIWRDLYGSEPESTPPYSPYWAQQGAGETLALAAERHLHPIATASASGPLRRADGA